LVTTRTRIEVSVSALGTQTLGYRRRRVWFGERRSPSIGQSTHEKEEPMLFTLFDLVQEAVAERVRTIRSLAEWQRGQGTVEYVGLILLVSLLMVGMVAAMKGFNGQQGTELASLIVDKITEAVDKVAFK
jgi:hypothetical protein